MGGRAVALATEHGFSLRSVCWGYRDVFTRNLEALLEEGRIGAGRERQTRAVFELLKQADSGCFDHVLHQFLLALNPDNAWLFDLPALFEEVVQLGGELGRERLHHGVRFFERLAAGGFGETPAEVRGLLTHVRRLREHGDDLAVALVDGYDRLRRRLRPRELERYIESGVTSYARDHETGCRFLRAELESSEHYIVALTRECRLVDAGDHLRHLLRALTGEEYEVGDLGALDSDELHDLGSTTICFAGQLYLPQRVRAFPTAAWNRAWFTAVGLWAAALHLVDGFIRVHGHPGHTSSVALVGEASAAQAVFAVGEYVRAGRYLRSRWPGAAALCARVLAAERAMRDSDGLRLLSDLLAAAPPPDLVGLDAAIADAINCFDLARLLRQVPLEPVLAGYPGLAGREPPPAFLPDFRYPAQPERAPADKLVADLRGASERRGGGEAGDREQAARRGPDGSERPADEDEREEAEEAATAGYVYPEWSQPEGTYYPDHCVVYEDRPAAGGPSALPDEIVAESRLVSRAFERLKPDECRRESQLSEGEDIDTDRLVRFLADRRHEPSPRVAFFSSVRPRRRDLAVGLLLDLSGSTGERCEDGQVLDLERHAGLILGAGLHAIGDGFELAGFSSNGPEHSEYLVFKDFDEAWGPEVVARLQAARPRDSTRIGPSLRHAGFRLGRTGRRQQLLIVITDGQPQDRGYDPHSRYAQHDVRMACEENRRGGIHTFGISTTANSLGDMEIMFPDRRFAILPDMRRLPRVLPALFTRLTC